jgi:hypothetical protein
MKRILIAIVGICFAVQLAAIADDKKKDTPPAKPKKKVDKNVISLFDGKTLKGWKSTNFGGEGDVQVKDGAIHLEFGNDMTGITMEKSLAAKLPNINYDLSYEAQRVNGSDFFCGLTFPVKKDPCSLILGGWGGGVCGLSSINGQDASENETTSFRDFKKGKWYKVKVRVHEDWIQAWIDDKLIVDQCLRDRKLSIRIEVELSRPFGFSTWQTSGALRKLNLRKLTAKEIKALDDKKEDE